MKIYELSKTGKLSWFRQLLRLPENTSAKNCIKRSTEICQETKEWTKNNMDKND